MASDPTTTIDLRGSGDQLKVLLPGGTLYINPLRGRPGRYYACVDLTPDDGWVVNPSQQYTSGDQCMKLARVTVELRRT